MKKGKYFNDHTIDYLGNFIGNELLPEDKECLISDGFLNIEDTLASEDKEYFDKSIKDGDETELVTKDGMYKIKVYITNIEFRVIKKNEFIEVKYTLVRK